MRIVATVNNQFDTLELVGVWWGSNPIRNVISCCCIF